MCLVSSCFLASHQLTVVSLLTCLVTNGFLSNFRLCSIDWRHYNMATNRDFVRTLEEMIVANRQVLS